MKIKQEQNKRDNFSQIQDQKGIRKIIHADVQFFSGITCTHRVGSC